MAKSWNKSHHTINSQLHKTWQRVRQRTTKLLHERRYLVTKKLKNPERANVPSFTSYRLCPDPEKTAGGGRVRRTEMKEHTASLGCRLSRQGQPWTGGRAEALNWMMRDGSFDLDQIGLFNNWKWDSKAVTDPWDIIQRCSRKI